jgi:hypothetical protein
MTGQKSLGYIMSGSSTCSYVCSTFETSCVCLFGGTVVKAFLSLFVLSLCTSPVPIFFVLSGQAYGLCRDPVNVCRHSWYCQFPRTATTSKII